MTEHIVNLAIGIDDESIRKSIIDGAERSIIADLKKDVITTLFTTRYYSKKPYDVDHYTGKVSVDNNAILKEFAVNIFKDTIAEYKDEIINRAAKEIADSIKRSKAFKQKMAEVTE